MTSLIRDGSFGIVVGEPSSNSPVAFTDMINFILPNTGLNLTVATSLVLRTDVNADQTMIHPDIHAPSSQALEAALEFFSTAPAAPATPTIPVPETALVASVRAASDRIRYTLGVDFEIIGRESSATAGGGAFSWIFISTGDYQPIFRGTSSTSSGNIFQTFEGEMLYVIIDGFPFLYVDIGSANIAARPDMRSYRVFRLN
jgi:hypothetical protein